MKKLGLIGYPLSHSFSAGYFADKFNRESLLEWSYELFSIDNIEKVSDIISDKEAVGFNVTIPYKKQIIPYLTDIDDVAAEIGAVNCVKIYNGRVKGYNTDIDGFESSLCDMIGHKRPSAIVLGTGGASMAVCYVLKKLAIDYVVVSRYADDGVVTYRDIDKKMMSERHLIVNCTPLGTFPDVSKAPDLPYQFFSTSHYVYDLVYNPSETLFIHRARKKGAAVCNGYRMLVGQAETGWKIFDKLSL